MTDDGATPGQGPDASGSDADEQPPDDAFEGPPGVGAGSSPGFGTAGDAGPDVESPDDPEEFDEWTALVAVTQDTRASLVADVVGHPEGAPSVRELDYANPGVERPTIEEHLGTLVEAGVLRKGQLPPGERTRDLPYTFYRLTDAARDLFDRANVFEERVWREQYERLEKPDDVLAAEEAPRPDW